MKTSVPYNKHDINDAHMVQSGFTNDFIISAGDVKKAVSISFLNAGDDLFTHVALLFLLHRCTAFHLSIFVLAQ